MAGTLRKTGDSELESFVLGLVWQRGPVSAYDIRCHMRDSPSTQWSGSAGAIYPLMQRLEAAGLLKGRAERVGKRARRVYSVTPRGVSVLRRWVGPPLAAAAISVAHDPLRSRARFLGILSPQERRAWIAAARAALDEVERRVMAWEAKHGAGATPGRSRGPSAMTRSGELDVRSRREWLDGFDADAEQAAAASAR